MTLRSILEQELDDVYKATFGLLDMVDADGLDWKPASGDNWMTVGQLLNHITTACGACFKGFATGDWGMPEGVDMENMKPEDMLPPAEAMESAASVDAARAALQDDQQLARQILADTSDDDLANKPTPAPWDPRPLTLGHRLLSMVGHLELHKAQLYYYLKLQGKPMNTWKLFGM